MPMSPRCWPPNLDSGREGNPPGWLMLVDWLVNSDSIHPAPVQSKIALGKWMMMFISLDYSL